MKKHWILIVLLIIILSISAYSLYKGKNKSKESSNRQEESSKLKILNNINEKLDFFNIEYLDRYLDYKENNSKLSDEQIIIFVNIGLDKEFYQDKNEVININSYQVLVNKYNYLSKDYVPNDLEIIDPLFTNGDKLLRKEAKVAFERLANEALKENLSIRAISTYRSYSYQESLYDRYVDMDGIEKADSYSARPGHSEHQTGLAVDVDNIKQGFTSFGKTEEYKWMQENAHKYGFIIRYTKENEHITGYTNEPWHYRYVGVNIATYIKNNSMTYEEYYVRFIENK